MYLLRLQRCSHKPLYLIETEIAPHISKLQSFKISVISKWGVMSPQGRNLKPVHQRIQKQEVQHFSTEFILQDKSLVKSKTENIDQFMTRNGKAKET